MSFSKMLEKNRGCSLKNTSWQKAWNLWKILRNKSFSPPSKCKEKSGFYKCTHEDKLNQVVFKRFCKHTHLAKKGFTLIGTHFLGAHRELLN